MRRWLAAAAIVVVAAGLGAYAYVRASRAAPEPPALWRTAVVSRGTLLVSVSGSGSIAPSAAVDVKSRATGTVVAVFVAEGDRVTAGQVLVRIADPDAEAAVRNARASLEAALARQRQAEAQRRAAAAEDAAALRQAEAGLATARARLQQVLAGARPQEVAQAEQAVRAAEAELLLAQRTAERTRQLFADGFIPQQQVDQAEAALRAAQAAHESARQRLAQLRAGATADQVAEARAAVRQAQALVEAARARRLEDAVRAQEVANARAQVSVARAALANAEARVAETLIRAPVAGIVAQRQVEVGQSVIGGAGTGTPVLTLAVDRPLVAKVLVNEADIAQVRPGLAVEVEADSLPGEIFRGTAEAISPQAQVVNNVVQYEARVRLTDPGGRLRLGMTVEAEFIVTRRADVLLVPREALRGGAEARAVLVVEGEKLVPRVVRTGGTDGRMVEIVEGLRPGEIVYLGEAPQATGASTPAPGRNPFAPQFPRRQAPSGPGRP